MRRSVLTFVLVGIVLAILVGLNVVLMSEPRRTQTEQSGDRSSYEASPFGTLAYYTLIEERGRHALRFQEPFSKLKDAHVATLFVIVPAANLQPSEEEITALEDWVAKGGCLVVIDREVHLETRLGRFDTAEQLAGDVKAVLPSPYTRGVSQLRLTDYATGIVDGTGESLVHFAAPNGALLIDKTYGRGHVTILTEPYIVQNNGIRENDNLALALNLVDGVAQEGTVAFDEYHHGHGNRLAGNDHSGLRGYVENTPVPWIVAQLGLLAIAVAMTAGARYGRAVPLGQHRRTSALEFVSSMANIQRLARASDVAVENVYSSFRARLCRYANVPSDTPPATLAAAAARRGGTDPARLRDAIDRCEDAMHGKSLTSHELVTLVSELRSIEALLKL